MSKVTSLTSDQSKIDLLEKAVKIRDRYGAPRMDRKEVVWRKRNYADLIIQSEVPAAALLWDVQGDDTKAVWNTAAAVCDMTGYELFIQIMTFRSLNGYTGMPVPKTQYQFMVLEVITGAGYQEWAVYQFHAQVYSLLQRQVGKKNATQWVEVVEDAYGTFVFSFEYFSQMTWASDPEEYYAYFWIEGEKESGYDIELHTFDLDMLTDWKHFEETIVTDFISFYGYEIGIHSVGAQGTILVDNMRFEYSGQNWAFDSKCEQVDQRIIDYGDGPDFVWWVNYDVGLESVDSLYLE